MDTSSELLATLQQIGIALGLGLLVGMQRQRTDSRLAGIRTFPLITVLGTVAGLLSREFGGWVLAATLIALAVVMVVSNVAKKAPPHDPGITTEVAILLMFGLGAYLVGGYKSVAVALGGVILVLLHLKPEMHRWVQKMGEDDFRAIVRFALVSLVILPILPNQNLGPYGALNPFKIWLLAVLIVGISLGGYVAYKFLGAKRGSVLNGVLGGLISSTATTLTYSRRARELPETTPMAALVIMTASAVVFLRVLVVILVVAPQVFLPLAGPLAVMFAATATLAVGAWLSCRHDKVAMPEHENPAELRPAIIFAALFALILLGVAAARANFGDQALYVVAGLSGLTDMDAITLSTLQTIGKADANTTLAWRMILVAALANVAFKGATVAVVGNRKLLGRMAILFGITLGVGIGILWLWPSGEP